MFGHAKYWRSRAEEARVLAELLEDAHPKRIMLCIASDTNLWRNLRSND
jgi:hypothetical protein